MEYVTVIKYATLIFPLVAFLFTIPFILIEYHKYGSISPLKSIITYLFIYYLLCAYFLVILPLPKISEVAKMASPVLTFLSENDFSGKIVVPFMTNAGWKGSVIKDMTALCKNAKVEKAKEIKFNEDILVTPEEELEKWIESLK